MRLQGCRYHARRGKVVPNTSCAKPTTGKSALTAGTRPRPVTSLAASATVSHLCLCSEEDDGHSGSGPVTGLRLCGGRCLSPRLDSVFDFGCTFNRLADELSLPPKSRPPSRPVGQAVTAWSPLLSNRCRLLPSVAEAKSAIADCRCHCRGGLRVRRPRSLVCKLSEGLD